MGRCRSLPGQAAGDDGISSYQTSKGVMKTERTALGKQDSNPGPIDPKAERLPLHHDATQRIVCRKEQSLHLAQTVLKTAPTDASETTITAQTFHYIQFFNSSQGGRD
ncbi:hypothetical protein ElyMa_006638000 [Elysia marginata]|uniref:Uncharacterized protein n=1 Tax=Elysia marginata TaxID=1093978 RepID=A0AAV4IK03_9GAST|nr:hypothetical protein ElyMa_006638000 [Elysia marginata]